MKNSEIRIKLEKNTEIRDVVEADRIAIIIVVVVAIIGMIEVAVALGTTIEGMIGVADMDVDEEMIVQAHVVLIVAEIRMKDRILQEEDIRNRVIMIVDHVITEMVVDIREVEADPVDAVDHHVVEDTITIEMINVVAIITTVEVIVVTETVDRAAVDVVAVVVVVVAAVVVAVVPTWIDKIHFTKYVHYLKKNNKTLFFRWSVIIMLSKEV